MASLIGLNVYKINNTDSVNSGSSLRMAFPFAGIMIRPIVNGFATAGGTVIYSMVQTLATGDQYGVIESSQAITALS
jgi:hypothetical protein